MTIKVGDRVSYWPERRPFLARDPYPSEVLGVEGGEPTRARLSVSNPHTKRAFLATVEQAEAPAPGRFTVPEPALSPEDQAAPSEPPPESVVEEDVVITESEV